MPGKSCLCGIIIWVPVRTLLSYLLLFSVERLLNPVALAFVIFSFPGWWVQATVLPGCSRYITKSDEVWIVPLPGERSPCGLALLLLRFQRAARPQLVGRAEGRAKAMGHVHVIVVLRLVAMPELQDGYVLQSTTSRVRPTPLATEATIATTFI